LDLIPFLGYHGKRGPLTVQTPSFLTPLGQAWPSAGKQIGYPYIDVNGPYQTGKP